MARQKQIRFPVEDSLHGGESGFSKNINSCVTTGTYGNLQMERRGKIMLLALLLLIFGALVVIEAYTLNVAVGYPIGFALALLGSILWLNAE